MGFRFRVGAVGGELRRTLKTVRMASFITSLMCFNANRATLL